MCSIFARQWFYAVRLNRHHAVEIDWPLFPHLAARSTSGLPPSLSLQTTWNCYPLETSQLQPVRPSHSACLLPCTQIQKKNTQHSTKRRTGPHFGRLKRGRQDAYSHVYSAKVMSGVIGRRQKKIEEVELECQAMQGIRNAFGFYANFASPEQMVMLKDLSLVRLISGRNF